jgi:hypothetical protein
MGVDEVVIALRLGGLSAQYSGSNGTELTGKIVFEKPFKRTRSNVNHFHAGYQFN